MLILSNSSMAVKLPLSSFTAIHMASILLNTQALLDFHFCNCCVYIAVYWNEYTFRMSPKREIAGKRCLAYY